MRLTTLGIGLLAVASFARAQAPVVNQGGVINAGSFAVGQAVAPGSIVSIFGTSLAASLSQASTIPLSTDLGDVTSVTFNGVTAALYYVGPMQINAQLPWDVMPAGTTSGNVEVVVTRSTQGVGGSTPQSVPVGPVFPGIFTTNQRGFGQAIATDNADGVIAAAAGSIAGLTTHPIKIGDFLIVWCTGLGAVDSPIANGANSLDKLRHTLAVPTVMIGNVPATFVYSILAPQYVSENQVAVQVAPGTPTGNAVPLQIQVDGVTTSATVTIAVSN